MLTLADYALYHPDRPARFDAKTLEWMDVPSVPSGAAITETEAVRWLQKESGSPVRIPVAVIGPREAEPEHLSVARQVGNALARLGLTVLCGGRQGVMEATCHGVEEGGGISIGLLPEGEWDNANPYVTIPLATGIGIARNALIARAALCVIAVGGGLGTISEMALALQFGKPVFALCHAPDVPGARHYASWAALETVFCRTVLRLDDGVTWL